MVGSTAGASLSERGERRSSSIDRILRGEEPQAAIIGARCEPRSSSPKKTTPWIEHVRRNYRSEVNLAQGAVSDDQTGRRCRDAAIIGAR